MRKKGFTLIELLVVIAIIAMLMAILMPALSKVKKIAMRVVCGTNLKGLGTAQTVYANDYDDEYVVQGRGAAHTWSNQTLKWADPAKNWATPGEISVGASLFLLVREADVSPKSFVCPASDQSEWDGITAPAGSTNIPDIVQVWDFGSPNTNNQGPTNCVSYSYHMPYQAGQTGMVSTGSKSRYAADGTRSAAFAVMADKNPYFDQKLGFGSGVNANNYLDRSRMLNWKDSAERWETLSANSQPHDREGQNVLFADGHTTYENRPDVAIKNDNIFTRWVDVNGDTEDSRRTGDKITARDTSFAPRSTQDSVLVNDDMTVPVPLP